MGCRLLRATTLALAGVACGAPGNEPGGVVRQSVTTVAAAPATAPAGDAVQAPVTRSLKGRLTGGFEPDRFSYEISFTKVVPIFAGPGEHTVTITSTSTSDEDKDEPLTATAGHDGWFDLGTVTIAEHDRITVVAAALGGARTDRSIVFQSEFRDRDSRAPVAQSPVLDRSAGTLEIVLPTLSTVELSAGPAAAVSGGRVTFTVWDERGGFATSYGEGGRCRRQMEPGSYLVRATQGDLTSPLTTFVVDKNVAPVSVPLDMQACPTFSIRLVGEPVAAGGRLLFVLGTDALAGMPLPCRVQSICRDGEVVLEHILPGTYEVELRKGMTPLLRQRMELRPDAPPIVLSSP
jgi:hypothetical protein